MAKGFLSTPCSNHPACRRYSKVDPTTGRRVAGCRVPECPLLRRATVKKTSKAILTALESRFAGLDIV